MPTNAEPQPVGQASERVERAQAREAFRQEAITAWEEYRSTGLHLTAEEVDAWLATWGTDHECPMPQCHT